MAHADAPEDKLKLREAIAKALAPILHGDYLGIEGVIATAIEREGVWIPWSDIQPMRNHKLRFMGRIEYYPTVIWHNWGQE